MTTVAGIRITGLGRQKLGQLAKKARRLGLTPARYVKQLVEDDLAISRHARTTSFAEILGPGRNLDDAELDAIIDRARTEHHKKTSRKKK